MRITQVAEANCRGSRLEQGAKGIVNRAFDVNAAGRHTGLPLKEKYTEGRGVHSLLEIGIREDNHRTLATQLKNHTLHPRATQSGDMLAHAAGSREPHRLHQRMRGERIADTITKSGDDIERAIGQTSLPVYVCQGMCDQWRFLGGQQNQRVASGERRGSQLGVLEERNVEGRDCRHHAHWLAHAHAETAWQIRWQRLAGRTPRHARCGTQAADCILHLELCLADRRAHLIDQQFHQCLAATFHDSCGPAQPCFTLGGQRLAIAGKRSLSRLHSRINVLRRRRSDARENRIVLRIAIIKVLS